MGHISVKKLKPAVGEKECYQLLRVRPTLISKGYLYEATVHRRYIHLHYHAVPGCVHFKAE